MIAVVVLARTVNGWQSKQPIFPSAYQSPETEYPRPIPEYDAVLIRDQVDLADPGAKAQTSGRYHTRSLLAAPIRGLSITDPVIITIAARIMDLVMVITEVERFRAGQLWLCGAALDEAERRRHKVDDTLEHPLNPLCAI
jgi:hypothetical protein